MKKILFILLIFSILACNKNKNSAVLQKISVASDSSLSYFIFLPSDFRNNGKFPLILLFDAHKDGKLAVSTLQSAAEKLGFIVVGSNNFENNIKNPQYILDQTLSDVEKRFKINNSAIFIGGFSGAGRFAQFEGFSNPTFKGIISFSAGLTPNYQIINKIPTVITFGTQDFNYYEGLRSVQIAQKLNLPLIVLFFRGKHQYPDSLTVFEALSYIYITAVKNNILKKDKNKIKIIEDYFINRCDTASLIEKYTLCNLAVNLLEDFVSTKKFEQQYQQISKSKQLRKYQAKMKNIQKVEQQLYQQYSQFIDTKDLSWWKKELKLLNQKIENATDEDIKDLFFRVKAFLGILCYSKSKQYSQTKDTSTLRKILYIYEKLEPQNKDMMFFKSYYYKILGLSDSSKLYFQKAINMGFDTTSVLYQNLKTNF